MEKNLTTIKVVKRTLKTKDGRDFDVFKCIRSDGKLVDLKFTKTCTQIPKGNCEIKVEDFKWNVDNSRLYPVVWVKEIYEIVENKTETKEYKDYFEN